MGLIVAIIVAIVVAVGAARLGYSGVLWFFAILFGGAFALGLIAALPDRKLEKKRRTELAELQLELANVRAAGIASPESVRSDTIGDRQTVYKA